MSLGWVIVGSVAWLVVALGAGLAIGQAVRQRDRQVPPAAEPETPDDRADQVLRIFGWDEGRR